MGTCRARPFPSVAELLRGRYLTTVHVERTRLVLFPVRPEHRNSSHIAIVQYLDDFRPLLRILVVSLVYHECSTPSVDQAEDWSCASCASHQDSLSTQSPR